eukprot:364792-Chlamydomonas_euryale.AAC.21
MPAVPRGTAMCAYQYPVPTWPGPVGGSPGERLERHGLMQHCKRSQASVVQVQRLHDASLCGGRYTISLVMIRFAYALLLRMRAQGVLKSSCTGVRLAAAAAGQ